MKWLVSIILAIILYEMMWSFLWALWHIVPILIFAVLIRMIIWLVKG